MQDIKRFLPGDAGYIDVLHALRSQHGVFNFSWDIGGELIVWCISGEIAAFAVLMDCGIETFEVCQKFRNQGYGSRMVRELKRERPELCVSGYAFSQGAAKFWRRLGLYD